MKIILVLFLCTLTLSMKLRQNTDSVLNATNATGNASMNANETSAHMAVNPIGNENNTHMMNNTANATGNMNSLQGSAQGAQGNIMRDIKDFNHGDIISLESGVVKNAYVQAMLDTCMNAQTNTECGNLTGIMGMSNMTHWMVKQGGANSYCLELLNSNNTFLLLNATDCTQGNNQQTGCGKVTLFKADTGNCGIEYGLRFVPITPPPNATAHLNATDMNVANNSNGSIGQNFVWAIQSVQNAEAFIYFDAATCKEGTTNTCGTFNIRMVNSVADLTPNSPAAFVIHAIDEEPTLG
jgi:hypothetical protein